MNLYCILFPNGKRYFGVETHTGHRWLAHKGNARRENPRLPVHKAIKHFGPGNCKFSYIYQDMPKGFILKLEIQFIKSYGTTDISKGYNVAPGGDSWSPDTAGRKKLSESLKAYFANMSPEDREAYRKKEGERMSKLHKGTVQSQERAEKSREAMQKALAKITPEVRRENAKAMWDARKAAGFTGSIAFTKKPRPEKVEKPSPRSFKGQHLKPRTEEYKKALAERAKAMWAKRKANGQVNWTETFGRPKKVGYHLIFTPEHKAKLSANKLAFYKRKKGDLNHA